MDILINLFKEIAVFLVVAYLFSKTPVFKLLLTKDFSYSDYLILYIFFTSMAIIGTYFGIPVHGAIANNRVIGAAIAGLIGGPFLGFGVGLTAGIHRYFLGGFTALSCGISTTFEGLMAGLVHSYFVRKGRYERVFDPDVAFFTTLAAEVSQMLIILLISKPTTEAVELVKLIAMPMIASNSVGAALIMSLFRDQRSHFDKIGSSYSRQALRIARRLIGELKKGLHFQSAQKIATIIHEETGVAAVAITDREKILAFVGIGSDHHKAGYEIASSTTKSAIKENKIIFLDGTNDHYICPISEKCKLTSVLVVPIRIKDEVIGTIKLYEQKNKFFFKINEALGKGIAELVANQLLSVRYEYQKNLLTKAELNLIQAQINPHFLFNAINTIIAVSRRDANKARDLLMHLSNYFRKNLKRNQDLSTIRDELNHVNSYLEIEKVRFQDHLKIEIDIDSTLMDIKIPTFTLQPLVENAIKHGISKILEDGIVKIKVFKNNGDVQINIEDNAGTYVEPHESSGLGIQIVDKRIKNLVGEDYGVKINCKSDFETIATVLLPGRGTI
ncbi:sensor histidine kinase YehU [bacterium BMS3Abin04]|nr:sensor histidine kinase YehU [bacterium BMS3Abin04]